MRKIVMGAHQHIGKRDEQQDAFGWKAGRVGTVAVVADGMGGHAGGAEASRLTVEALTQAAERSWSPTRTAQDFIVGAVVAADAVVQQRQRADPALRDMGTTVVAVAWRHDDPDHAVVAHCGDSRAYVHFTNGRFVQLTQDHARGHRLTQCVGLPGFTRDMIETVKISTPRGTRVLLSSDGLHGVMAPTYLQEHMGHTHLAPEAAAKAMVQTVAQAGGRDNITALIVEF